MIAESFLKHGIESLSGGERHVVHVDAETLRHSTAGCCEIEDGPSMAAETARRLACDASLVTIVEDADGDPLDVGRKTRTIPPALRRALNARDRGCRFPGCCNTQFVDAHHVQHWVHGGETKLSNLTILCRFHHRCVHEGGFQIQVLDDGALRFLSPHGMALDSVAAGHTQPFADVQQVPLSNRDRGVTIDARTAVARWCGERMDYGLAVEVLMQRRTRAKMQTGAEQEQKAARCAEPTQSSTDHGQSSTLTARSAPMSAAQDQLACKHPHTFQLERGGDSHA